jgi:hypothetical protein
MVEQQEGGEGMLGKTQEDCKDCKFFEEEDFCRLLERKIGDCLVCGMEKPKLCDLCKEELRPEGLSKESGNQ